MHHRLLSTACSSTAPPRLEEAARLGFFQMGFESEDELERAFATVLGCKDVEFCNVDASRLRLSFRTRAGCPDPLLARLGVAEPPPVARTRP